MAYGESEYADYSQEDQRDLLYEQIGFGTPGQDPELHQLFYDYYYNDNLTLRERMDTYDALVERVQDRYDIDFFDIWDWEDFRAWYESA